MKLTLLLEEYLDGPEVGVPAACRAGSALAQRPVHDTAGHAESRSSQCCGHLSPWLRLRQCTVGLCRVRRQPSGYCCPVQVDVDLVLSEGAPVYGAITDNWPTIEPYFNETGSNCPSILPRQQQSELMELGVQSVQALGLSLVGDSAFVMSYRRCHYWSRRYFSGENHWGR